MHNIRSIIDKTATDETGFNGKMSRDEEIYQNIYTAIVEHYIAPGTKLPEDALAESFNVSRTIIRKVLLSLDHDGLVTIAPKRGARVSRPSAREGKEVFEARRLIEVSAIPLVIDAISERQLKILRKLVKDQKQAELDHDYRSVIRLSGDFHQALIAVTGNHSLIEFLRNLISRSSLIVAVYGSSRAQPHSCQDHDELLGLIVERKVEDCQHWMSQHLRHVEDSLEFAEKAAKEPDLKKVFSQIRAEKK